MDLAGVGMRIKQDRIKFSPIHIKLETQAEAQRFFDLIGKVDDYHNNANGHYTLTGKEYKLIIQLSNSLANCECIVP